MIKVIVTESLYILGKRNDASNTDTDVRSDRRRPRSGGARRGAREGHAEHEHRRKPGERKRNENLSECDR